MTMKCIKFTKTDCNDRSRYGCDCRVVTYPEQYFNDWIKENPSVNIQFIHTGFDPNGYPMTIMVYYYEAMEEQ